jgi:GNAT superfamily N-acetyltransferase
VDLPGQGAARRYLRTLAQARRCRGGAAPAVFGRLATAACCAIVEWAQRQGFVRIQATLLIGNETSRRVLERAGFEHEGRLRKYRWIEGRAHDVLVYSHLPAWR